jgi:DNA-binding response OmpR family regulator
MDAPNRSDVTVLIAEDSRIQAQILSKKLEDAGFRVRVAENGAVALESIRKERPTVVISDIEMPTMTGYELCSAVKGDPELRTIPFILLSTLSEPRDIIRGLHCGADNYVTKPYDPDFLIARTESLLTTPLGDSEDVQKLDVTLAGESYTVNSSSQQVLNLLVSTFENAVEKNNELIETNQELTLAKEQLTVWNQKLEELNGKLEQANGRMSRDLNAAAKVQQSLLPSATPETSNAQFAWKYLPCDELAGDFLNVFPLDDKHIAGPATRGRPGAEPAVPDGGAERSLLHDGLRYSEHRDARVPSCLCRAPAARARLEERLAHNAGELGDGDRVGRRDRVQRARHPARSG